MLLSSGDSGGGGDSCGNSGCQSCSLGRGFYSSALSPVHSGPDYDFFGHKSHKALNGKECYKSWKLTKKNVVRTKFLCLVICAVVGKFY